MYPNTQAIIHAKQQAGVFPGAVYQFIEDHQIETHVLGKAVLVPKEEKMTADYLFDVASLTKVICTTSVVLRLWEQGKLDIDRPLKSYLFTFENPLITLRHLLTHTSDIQTWIENRDQLSAEELRAAYLTLQPGDYLGKKVCYTDAGTILLGFMLEELFGQPATTIFQQEVLNPLGMNDSQFPPILHAKVAPTQQVGTKVLRGETHDPKARVLGKHAGNAGLFTNITDIQKFVEAYFTTDYLKPKTLALLMTDQTPTGHGGRSLGWDLRGGMLFHTGYTGTFLLIHPQAKRAFIFLSNRVHPEDHRASYIEHRDEIIATYFDEQKL